MTAARHAAGPAPVEAHHIDIIPVAQRTDKAWKQFPFWLGSNFNAFNVILGGFVAVITGSFTWALVAIAVGTGLGALLIALHGTQGPHLGCRRPSSPGRSSGSTACRSCTWRRCS